MRLSRVLFQIASTWLSSCQTVSLLLPEFKLTRLVIDFEKIQSSIIALKFDRQNLPEFLTTISRRCHELMNTKEIKFEMIVAKDIPRLIMMDRVKYTQLLLNILTNAFKFTPSGGSVRFSVSTSSSMSFSASDSTLDLSTTEMKTTLKFKISDTGPGIPPSDIPRLFDAYSTITHENEFKGSGLGLSITKKIVEKFGGTIDVESTVGVGTTFKIEIPVEVLDEQPLQEVRIDMDDNEETLETKALLTREPAEPSLPSDLKILIVDDSLLNRKILKKLLIRMIPNAKITEAGDGIEALQVFSPGAFDVIFMDLIMPNLDGWEASRQIRAIDHDIKIIICSASDTQRDDDLLSRVNAFLIKPFTIDDIRNELSRVFTNQAVLSFC